MVSHESFNRARNGFCAPPEEKSSLFLVMATREALFLVLDGCGDCPTPKLRLEVDSIRFTNVETSISSRRRLRRLEKRGFKKIREREGFQEEEEEEERGNGSERRFMTEIQRRDSDLEFQEKKIK